MTIATLKSLITSGEFTSPRMSEVEALLVAHNLPDDAEVPQEIQGLLLAEAAEYEELASELNLVADAAKNLEEAATEERNTLLTPVTDEA